MRKCYIKKQKNNELIISFIFGICLLLCQPTYATKKISRCQMYFMDSFISHLKYQYRLNKLEKPQDIFVPSLESNELTSIRQALNSDGAVIVNINAFTLEIVKKMRQAIHEAVLKNSKLPSFLEKIEYPSYFYFNPNDISSVKVLGIKFRNGSLEKDWRDFTDWLENKTQVISSGEIKQFQKEAADYANQIKQIILEVDGQNIELESITIRTDKYPFVVAGHKHYEFPFTTPSYITVTVAPIGLSTFYMRAFDIRGERIMSNSGGTVIMSEKGRARKVRSGLPFHGSPDLSGERFFLLFSFKISK